MFLLAKIWLYCGHGLWHAIIEMVINMNIINLINEKTILIMPNNIKNKVLRSNKQLINIKSLTEYDLQKKLLFDYDEKTIHYMVEKYNLKVDVVLMYLKNMYYIDLLNYESSKLNKLSLMKQDLLSHDLLIKDELFLDSLSDSNVIVYGYNHIDKFFKKLLNILATRANVQIIEDDNPEHNDQKIYEFNDIEDEVNFVGYSICELIKNGIDVNYIKLGNISSDYMIPIKRIFSFYKIPINLNDNISLYGTSIALSFINLFNETHSFKDSLERLGATFNLREPSNIDIYNKLVSVCNNYIWYNNDCSDIVDMFISDFKKVSIKAAVLTNAVDLIDLRNNVIDNDNYVFVMGFNQGSMPIIYKNEDYITDDLAATLNLETTYEKNMIEGEVCLNIIKHIAHAIITYKLKTNSSEYYPSSLIASLEIPVIKDPKTNINISYSSVADSIALSKKLDKLVKYDELESDIDVLFNNYQDISYKTYDNSFKGIDTNKLLNYLSPKISLSYSSIDDYFKCAFKYYINSVMRLKSREEAFHLTIGNLFHYVLSHAFEDDFDFDNTWKEYLKDKELTSKEQYFLLKLKDELKFIIRTLDNQRKLSTFDKALYEEKIHVNLPNKIDVTFSGIIDKIMYKEGNSTLISLIDYKTGNTDINIDNVIHGLNMQLPVYLYLVKNSHKFNNPTFVGFYLQEILHNEIYNDHTKDYETKKQDALKLKGYTIDQEDLISQFDSSYPDSRVIKSMKIGKNGFYAYSKILNDNQINKLIDLVGSKIDEGASDILDAKFDINPKRLGGKNVACEYCDFRDICYMRDSNVITLKELKDDDFVGGEDDE